MTNKKKEPKYEGKFVPSDQCGGCDGRGEVKDDYIVGGLFGPSSHWTYKKCLNCNGTGKNLWTCLWCGNGVTDGDMGDFWCPNLNCDKYAVKVALASKQDS